MKFTELVRRASEYTKRFIFVHSYCLIGKGEKRKFQVMEKIYSKVNHFMLECGEPYWLDYGTLLGFFREKDFISHDIDVDFASNESSFGKIWASRHFLPKGFKMHDTSYKHRGSKLYINYLGFDADIYFYENRKDQLRNFAISSIPSENAWFDESLVYPLIETEFKGLTCFIPQLTEQYLTRIYGYIGSDAVFNPLTGYYKKRG